MVGDWSGVLGRLGRAWGWILAYGVLTVLAGIIAVIWPGATLTVIAIVFAIQLLFGAVYQFVFTFAIPHEAGWLRGVVAILAVLALVVAFYLLGHLGLTLFILAILLGAYWVVQGATELFVAIGHPEIRSRLWVLVSGILSLLAGGIVLIYPGESLVFLTIVLGFWLILFGLMLIGRSIQLRSFAPPPAASPAM